MRQPRPGKVKPLTQGGHLLFIAGVRQAQAVAPWPPGVFLLLGLVCGRGRPRNVRVRSRGLQVVSCISFLKQKELFAMCCLCERMKYTSLIAVNSSEASETCSGQQSLFPSLYKINHSLWTQLSLLLCHTCLCSLGKFKILLEKIQSWMGKVQFFYSQNMLCFC